MFSKQVLIPIISLVIAAAAIAWVNLDASGILRREETVIELPALVDQGRTLDSIISRDVFVRDSLQDRFFHTLSEEAGKEYGVKASVLYAIWVRESALVPSAKGDGDRDTNGVFIPGTWRAFGIGQVHLTTARKHFDEHITREMLLDPIYNGFISAKVLRDYLDLMGGDYIYAISAYQQGPAPAMRQKKNKELPANWSKYVYPVIVTMLNQKE